MEEKKPRKQIVMRNYIETHSHRKQRLEGMVEKAKGRAIHDGEREALSYLACALSPSRYLKSIGYSAWDWQNAILDDDSRRINVNGARQSGKSTIMACACCHMAKFRRKSLSVILTPSLKQSNEDMIKVNQFIAMDKNYPKQLKNNSQEIVLENGSRILVLTASDDAARGFSNPDLILFDEASRIDDSVYKAVIPMITNNRHAKVYEISTPNGKKGFFYNHHNSERWSRYIIKSKYRAVITQTTPELVEIEPEEMPGYHFYISPRHCDYEGQMGMLEEINWDTRNFAQEYGCEFVDSQDQVFAQDLIERMFGSVADSDSMIAGDGFAVAEPDPEFTKEYGLWNMQASNM